MEPNISTRHYFFTEITCVFVSQGFLSHLASLKTELSLPSAKQVRCLYANQRLLLLQRLQCYQYAVDTLI